MAQEMYMAQETLLNKFMEFFLRIQLQLEETIELLYLI